MEKINIKVCIRPYFHDVVDEISRKPAFNESSGLHYVMYKSKKYPIAKTSAGYILWMDEE